MVSASFFTIHGVAYRQCIELVVSLKARPGATRCIVLAHGVHGEPFSGLVGLLKLVLEFNFFWCILIIAGLDTWF